MEAGFAVYIKPGAGDDDWFGTLPSLVFRDLVSGQEQFLQKHNLINPDLGLAARCSRWSPIEWYHSYFISQTDE